MDNVEFYYSEPINCVPPPQHVEGQSVELIIVTVYQNKQFFHFLSSYHSSFDVTFWFVKALSGAWMSVKI